MVVNTVGPFATTALEVVRACPHGAHSIDRATELLAVERALDLDRQATAADRVSVTGTGIGAPATGSAPPRLCEGQPPAPQLCVDALASLASIRQAA